MLGSLVQFPTPPSRTLNTERGVQQWTPRSFWVPRDARDARRGQCVPPRRARRQSVLRRRYTLEGSHLESIVEKLAPTPCWDAEVAVRPSSNTQPLKTSFYCAPDHAFCDAADGVAGACPIISSGRQYAADVVWKLETLSFRCGDRRAGFVFRADNNILSGQSTDWTGGSERGRVVRRSSRITSNHHQQR